MSSRASRKFFEEPAQWCCDLSISAAASGLTSGRRRQHQRNRFFVGINISIRHCALRPHTPDIWLLASSGLSESCPKIGDVPKSPVPHIGSPGAVGRHNDASNKKSLVRQEVPRSARASEHHRSGSLRLIEGQGNSSATMTVPHYISENQSDMRGIKHGWYAIEDGGNLSDRRETRVGSARPPTPSTSYLR